MNMPDSKKRLLFQKQAQVAQAIGHPLRLAIIDFLKDGPQCVCDIAEYIGSERSNVSRHLSPKPTTPCRNASAPDSTWNACRSYFLSGLSDSHIRTSRRASRLPWKNTHTHPGVFSNSLTRPQDAQDEVSRRKVFGCTYERYIQAIEGNEDILRCLTISR